MKKVLFFILVFLCAPLVHAQEEVVGYFMTRYDLDATSLTFCRSEGQNGSVFEGPVNVQYTADSSGTAVTSATASTSTFDLMAALDAIYLTSGGVIYPRSILTYTDVDTLVTDEALTASGAKVSWRKHNCGTGVTNGWISTRGINNITIGFFLTQYVGDGNGLDMRVEGTVETPDGTTNVVQLWPTDKTVGGAATVDNFTTAAIASNLFINVNAPVSMIRIGVLHNTADDGNDLTTNAEQVTAVLYGQRVVR